MMEGQQRALPGGTTSDLRTAEALLQAYADSSVPAVPRFGFMGDQQGCFSVPACPLCYLHVTGRWARARARHHRTKGRRDDVSAGMIGAGLPLRIGSPEDFARVETALREADFTEQAVCRTLDIEAMSKIGMVRPADVDLSAVPERFALFCRLFLFLEVMPRAEVERVLDDATLKALLRLGVLRLF
jgi:hypothetical protein